ncbi:survival protein sure-like phosphatase/nucleotidase [Clohesyomyces aquaticus]|uniref:Survival protein sure-like phosphatase/nucleotidase n=1 Tax=Clohesyomyces aquaticus TaxID=1231657 RepID=A0A1Y1YB54_9PLEO|nr:survival protein sure-like phosphatase/nucleotidase [Clohesyomyces aquaticus]
MRHSWFLLVGLPLTQAARVIQSNDDGWAEINIRTFFNSLTNAGHSIVLSAPAENQSGTGSSDATPKTVDSDGCEFGSCPAKSPPTGTNSSNTRLNYVNSFPVTSIKTGIDTTAPKFFDGAKPEIALTGPNVGSNLGIQVPFSGTVGAAVYAVKTAGIPAIAFSGSTGDPTAWNKPTPLYSQVYADLALNVTSTVLASGTPYLPAGVWLNVNFPAVSSTKCNNANQFSFVLSRIYSGLLSPKDVNWCGTDRLPTENSVVSKGCYVSISMGDASDKTDINDDRQAQVLAKLKPILSCLP